MGLYTATSQPLTSKCKGFFEKKHDGQARPSISRLPDHYPVRTYDSINIIAFPNIIYLNPSSINQSGGGLGIAGRTSAQKRLTEGESFSDGPF